MIIGPSAAVVATDTLAVNLDGSARQFTTKAFIVPHLKMIIAGTGLAGFAGAWFQRVNEAMVVSDIDHLNFHTQKSLKNLFATEFSDFDPKQISTTIYQIGVSQADGVMHGYSYSSFYDFEPRELMYGLSIKPAAGPEPDPANPRDIGQLMRDQRALQEQEPIDRKIYIGGEIQAIHLKSDGTAILSTIDRFEDFQEMEDQIYKNFQPK
jgi:hypothetical protein